MNKQVALLVVGAGPAGLAAALAAWESGVRDILLVERECELGGILNQCIHNGFGLHRFGEELTGPEYAARYCDALKKTGVEVALNTTVLSVEGNLQAHLSSREAGYYVVQVKAVVLAMGCRERTAGAIALPGDRPSGVLTAGTAQRYLNIEGYTVGKRVVILGSGDIGLIMARRLTLSGAQVLACVEVMPYSGGLKRNVVQCLDDFDIPLLLSHTVVQVEGRSRVEKVVVAKVDENRCPIAGTEQTFLCDTLLLSVGLIAENELSRKAGVHMDARTQGAVVHETMQTSLPGVFACGNVLQVHDLVDFVSEESARAGKAAAQYLQKETEVDGASHEVEAGNGIAYTVPQKIHRGCQQEVRLYFRVKKVFWNCRVQVQSGGVPLASFKRVHMAPGEMETITLPMALLQKATGDLSVEVVL